MNDDELRAAAEEVARALGLTAIARQCDMCGFQSNDYVFCPCHNDTRSNKTQMRTTVEAPLNLLTDAGALALQDAIVKQDWFLRLHRYMQHEEAGLREYFSVSLMNTETGQEFYRSQDHADTWQAALVLAAHAALRAGWPAEEGSDG